MKQNSFNVKNAGQLNYGSKLLITLVALYFPRINYNIQTPVLSRKLFPNNSKFCHSEKYCSGKVVKYCIKKFSLFVVMEFVLFTRCNLEFTYNFVTLLNELHIYMHSADVACSPNRSLIKISKRARSSGRVLSTSSKV